MFNVYFFSTLTKSHAWLLAWVARCRVLSLCFVHSAVSDVFVATRFIYPLYYISACLMAVCHCLLILCISAMLIRLFIGI